MAIYLAPATRQNIEVSIEKNVPLQILEKYLDNHLIKEISERGKGIYHCWAMTRAKKRDFMSMALGDTVLLSESGTKKFNYGAHVICKIQSPALGNSLWPFVGKNPWEFIYFLTDVISLNILKRDLLNKLNYSTSFDLPGPLRVSDDRMKYFQLENGDLFTWLNMPKPQGLLLQEPSSDTKSKKHDFLEEVSPPQPKAFREKFLASTSSNRTTYFWDDKNNEKREIGLAGEKLVLMYEKQSLINNGRGDLAEKVCHSSVVDGDGLGYDIRSYTLKGEVKYIEVKTTSGSIRNPFFITANEVDFARNHSEEYYLFRVFEFKKERNLGKLYIIENDIDNWLTLEPTEYKAFI
ncbi:DUF3883 domain-containing protein [Trichocoleus sp. FACHB-591]|nr:DUF3883 domain-containing protein [Trichocoleus sp. FACHB-591]